MTLSPALPRWRVWLFLWLACWSWAALADVSVPALTSRVTDLTGTLDAGQRQALESRLQAFEQQKGSQLAVLIVPTTQPESIEQYGIRVVEQWKLGRKNVDDGALLLVARDDRTVRIEVGYGLEGALNDATCNRIIQETIVPAFRQGDFAGGISQGLERMMQVVNGEPLPAAPARPARSGRGDQTMFTLIAAALIGGGILRALFGALPGALLAGGLVGVIAWSLTGTVAMALFAAVAAFFLTLIGVSGLAGGYYGGGYGGRGGGGFGGGGGGFGGGGASGRW